MSKFLVSLEELDSWFHKKKRMLPWRNNPSIYRVWISEIMLQQTQVVTVIPYFEKFIHRFPTVEELAASSEEEVMLYWSGLGYYSRARNLHRGAQKIVEMGRFPNNREEWLQIPGVGNYTAGAILSIASGQPEAILDGNVERVLSRVYRVDRQKGDTEFKARLWEYSTRFVKEAFQNQISPSVLNQSLMELGATICTPKKPKCELCPLSKICQAYAQGDQESFPPKKKPKEWIHVEEEMHCVLGKSGQVLLRKRTKGEWRAGLWDLLEFEPKNRFKHLGQVETRHVVTRHKIKRVTHIWRPQNHIEVKPDSIWKAAEPNSVGGASELKWVSISDPEVAIGSALKRTLKAVIVQMEGEIGEL